MSSLKNLFRKKHIYENISQIKELTPEQIVRLDPAQISSHIEDGASKNVLSRPQRQALTRLLAIKKQLKSIPSLNREKAITDFLEREGLHDDKHTITAVDELLVNTQRDLMKEQLATKDLENRVHKLGDRAIIPDTDEEAIYRRLQALKLGGRKTVSNRKRRRKGRKSKKSRRK